jgi:hypothetical protein
MANDLDPIRVVNRGFQQLECDEFRYDVGHANDELPCCATVTGICKFNKFPSNREVSSANGKMDWPNSVRVG